ANRLRRWQRHQLSIEVSCMHALRLSAFALVAALALPATMYGQSVAASPTAAPAGHALSIWEIDPVHSELSFRIRHLVGRVVGTFTEWGGTLEADPATL